MATKTNMRSKLSLLIALVAGLFTYAAAARAAKAQVETVAPSGAPQYVWVSNGRIEGHLAKTYSPADAFSPDSSTLAVINDQKVALMDLAGGGLRKVLRVHLEGVESLDIQSANFLAPNRLFLLANGLALNKTKGVTVRTPPLAFQWDLDQDALSGKLNAVGAEGGYLPVRFFPQIGYVGLYKQSNFDLWNPATGRGVRLNVAMLAHPPHVFVFSPDGNWLVLAQIEMNATPDPIVVMVHHQRFDNSLRGHHGAVLSVNFSRDSKRVVTACEDGSVRVYSAPDWKLLETFTGHNGPVHWAEFSPDGQFVVSAGEDGTARIWSVGEGKLVQMLSESKDPLLTVSFSPNGSYLAATADKDVLVWKRTPTN